MAIRKNGTAKTTAKKTTTRRKTSAGKSSGKKGGRKKQGKQRRKINKEFIILAVIIIIALILFEYYQQKSVRDRELARTESVREIGQIKDLEIPEFVKPTSGQVVKHSGFTISYSQEHRIPNWVAYELTVDETKGGHTRADRFIPDPFVKGATAITSDYTNSGYDRGHMAPAADMKWSLEAMEQSFFLSNICPQHPDLNRRAWKILEERVRDWAVADSAILIVCGPLVHDKCKRIGKNKVTVPDGFFKVILSPFASPPQSIGFLFKNNAATNPLYTYVVTVDSVESVTGLDFFYQLPDSIEAIVEKQFDLNYWGLKK